MQATVFIYREIGDAILRTGPMPVKAYPVETSQSKFGWASKSLHATIRQNITGNSGRRDPMTASKPVDVTVWYDYT